MEKKGKNIGHIILLAIVCIFTYFVNNQTFYTDIMESRNIITAREMVYDGHWLVPTMNGQIRLEKPPLPTWITAVAEEISPDNLNLQRGMAGIAATMLVFFFYLFGCSITKREDFAWIASLILCTSYNIVLMGRTASWDIYCHAFMMGAIYFLYRAMKEDNFSWTSCIAAGIFSGLSFMSKGPISFYGLLIPFLIAFFMMDRTEKHPRWNRIIVMILLCIVISSWWYIYIYCFHYSEMTSVVHKETKAWTEHHPRPWYYYDTFYLEMGVWALMILTAIIYPLWTRRVKQKNKYMLLLLWLVFQLILLSLFPEKKKRYLLPMLIPSSYLIAFVFTYWKDKLSTSRDKLSQAIYSLNTYLIALACLSVPIVGYHFIYQAGYLDGGQYLFIASLLVIVSAWLLYTAWKKKPFPFVYGIVVLFMIGESIVMPYIGDLANNTHFKGISQLNRNKAIIGIPFHHVESENMRIEIVYEAHRTVTPINVTDSAAMMRAVPFILLSHEPVNQIVPPRLLKQLHTQWLGRYDNNRRPKGTPRYDKEFIYEATIIKKK